MDAVYKVVAVFLAAPAYGVRDKADTSAAAVLTLTLRRMSRTRTVKRPISMYFSKDMALHSMDGQCNPTQVTAVGNLPFQDPIKFGGALLCRPVALRKWITWINEDLYAPFVTWL